VRFVLLHLLSWHSLGDTQFSKATAQGHSGFSQAVYRRSFMFGVEGQNRLHFLVVALHGPKKEENQNNRTTSN
jgi:hypothetical protein